MNLLLSDTDFPDNLPIQTENQYVNLSNLSIRNCLGCFGCWTKTPGKCVIRDDAITIYPKIAKSKNLIYVTQLYCGCYDEILKTMLERAIPTQQAFLRLHHNETHHVQRNVVEKQIVIIAYGDISPKSQSIFQKLVARNANNMIFSHWNIRFVPKDNLQQTIVEEVLAWENCL